MSTNRDTGQTPWDTSLVPGTDAVGLEPTGQPAKVSDTACIITGEGTPSPENDCTDSQNERIISSNPRVPVLSIEGEPLMPTKSSRARHWLKSGRARGIRTKLGLFAVVLTKPPSGRARQPIALGIDPGSKYTGIAVCSSDGIHCGFNLELPDYIKVRMDKRRERRRNRRYRKCRRRKCRSLNRTRCKLAPSIRARKQLELRVVRELSKTFPISNISMEDVCFDHYNKRYGWYFSQVEIGKNWLLAQLTEIADTKLFHGWETSKTRKELGTLPKTSTKDARVPEAHVHDAITLCTLAIDNRTYNTNYEFRIIRRPKYSRRKLHLEQPAKGGLRRDYGSTTTPFKVRKGDYVEAMQSDRTHRGWVSGYTSNTISVSNGDWKRLGQFTASKVRLLERNTGILQFIPRLKKGVSLEEAS